MEFGLFLVGAFLALIALLMAVGRWYPGTGAEQLDWKPTRSYEDEVRLELEDMDQMLELQNERRRRRGARELTEDGMRAEVEAEERERRARAARYRSSPSPEQRPPGGGDSPGDGAPPSGASPADSLPAAGGTAARDLPQHEAGPHERPPR